MGEPEAQSPPSQGPSAAHSSQEPAGRLVLRAVELEGFKSYAERVVVGDPLGAFTCVIGPNGSGKSVVGEAIAFALGGNARMLRNSNLGSLVCTTPGLPPKAAEVTMHFEVGETGRSAGTPAAHRLLIRRRVSRAGRSELAVRWGERPWQATTPAALRDLLAPLGVQTEAVDRFVVSQQRQAVHVQSPAQLAAFLEGLVGGAALAERLAAVEAEADEVATRYDELEARAVGLEARRQQLAPVAERWRSHSAAAAAHAARKIRVQRAQVALLQRQIASGSSRAAELKGVAAAQARQQGEAKADADGLLQRTSAVRRELVSAQQALARLAEAAAAAKLQAARLKVRLKAAEAAAAAGGGKVRRQLEERLAESDAQVERLRSALATAHAGAKKLQQQEEAAEAHVQRLRGEAEATDSVASLAAVLGAAERRADQAAAAQAVAATQHQQACACLAAAEAETSALAGAARQQQGRERDAAAAVERLRAEQRTRHPQLQRAEAALLASRHSQCQAQAAAHEAQSALAAARDRLADATQRSAAGTDVTTTGGRQSPDAAVRALVASWPGVFHGRLHSVARLAQPQAGVAVNAVLAETAGLAGCVVVADRATALQVVAHYEAHRVGLVTCRILDELPCVQQQPQPPQQGADAVLLRPLAACVEARPGMPGAQALVTSLLGRWWLAGDREAALEAVRWDRAAAAAGGGRRRRSIATLAGELFKADGEVVAARVLPAQQRHCQLGAAIVPASGPADGAIAQQQDAASGDAGAGQLRERVASLRAEAAEAQRQAAQAAAAAERAEEEAAQLQQAQQAVDVQLAGAEGRLRLAQAARQKLEGQGQLAGRPRKLLAAAQAKRGEAAAALQAADGQLALAEEELAAARSAYAAGVAACGVGDLLAADERLAALRQRLARAQGGVEAAEVELAAATHQRQQLAATQRAAEDAVAEVQRLSGQLRELGSSQQRHEAKRLAAAVARHEQLCEQLDAEWQAAVKRHERATLLLQQAQVALRELKATQALRRQKLAGVRVELAAGGAGTGDDCAGDCERQQVEPGTASVVDSEQGCESEADGPQRRRRKLLRRHSSASLPSRQAAAHGSKSMAAPSSRRRLVRPSSSESEEGATGSRAGAAVGASCSKRSAGPSASARRAQASSQGGPALDGSDSDFDVAPRRRGRRDRARRNLGKSVAEEGRAGDWGEVEVAAALQDLAEREEELRAEHAAIDHAGVAEHAAAEGSLAEAGAQLDALADVLRALEDRRGALQAERFQRFHSALTTVNQHLTGIYSRLTGRAGDAYCSYTEDVVAAFTDGVTFHVRPDRRRWRAFSSLSGGQQALATLALSFALQKALPSPFYFFDEVDCALDTVNAARVAGYIADQVQRPCPAQFLVVSHRPQVYERAGCLVGVYAAGAASAAVTLHVGAAGGVGAARDTE